MIYLKPVSQTHSWVLLHFSEKFSSPPRSSGWGSYFNFCEKANRRIFAFADYLYLPLSFEYFTHFPLDISPTFLSIFQPPSVEYFTNFPLNILPLSFEYFSHFEYVSIFLFHTFLWIFHPLFLQYFSHLPLNISLNFL